MHKIFKKIGISFLSFSMLFSLSNFSPNAAEYVQAASTAKIHYLTLSANTEAILLECNGKFGIVDSGEDNDYPNGTDPRYPTRPGIEIGNGFEAEVISYMHSVGVTQENFEFYIGTHPHSDHIGSADEVIREFHPKRVYIQEYKDIYVNNPYGLWDNLYVYDHMLEASQETGATIIQNFDPSAPLYPEKVSVQGSVFWDDGENQDEIRPSQVTVKLTNPITQDSQDQIVQPDASGKWTYNFDQLQKYDDSKSPIKYEVSLEAPAKYTVSSNNTYDFTCSHTPVTSNEVVTITWNDSEAPADSRPASLNVDVQKQTPVQLPDNGPAESTEQDGSDLNGQTSAWESVQKITLTSDDTGAWNYTLEKLPKVTESGETIIYRLQVLDTLENYSFECPEESFSITASYTGSLISPPDAGIQDASPDPVENNGTTDNMHTFSIPATDKVDPNNTADPTNIRSSDSASAREGKFEALNTTQNTTSTPNFTLGNDMKIEIMHYGGDYKTNPKPDANYFSLGVKVTANGKTAFLAGDINNYEGAETALAQSLGHVDILTLGHHGYYGSNTYSYLNALNPRIMVIAGTFSAVSNVETQGEKGTLDTLLSMGKKGVPLYVTGWYHSDIPALVFNFDNALSNNIPKGKSFIGAAAATTPIEHIAYYDGIPTAYNGWLTSNGYTCYFDNSYYSARNTWIHSNNGQYFYLNSDGVMAVNDWVKSNGKWYYVDGSGIMQTGWVQVKGAWYYLDAAGVMATGRQTINGAQYYFTGSGVMTVSAWADGRYYGPDGKWIPNYKNNNWRKNSRGWWYQRPDGSWPANQWELIDGAWYYFDGEGYMVTGWLLSNNVWYYLNSDGVMQTGWLNDHGTRYYLLGDGRMTTDWQLIDGAWYYMNSSGAMTTGWQYVNNVWYYMDSSGRMLTGWQRINGSWYFLQGSGAMQTGWLLLNGTWYYLNPSGAMLGQGWHWIGGKCYYMYSSGAMAANTWISGYYVDGSGAWIQNYTQQAKWIQSGSLWWYRHADGSYTRSDWEKINGKWYLFDGSGWMLTGWQKVKGTWYYLNPSGDMLGQGWHWINGKCYYMYSSGAMAANTRVEGYYVDPSGAWIPGA